MLGRVKEYLIFFFLRLKKLLSLFLNALRACVYIYFRQLSSFRAPTLWLIDLTVATCHIPSGLRHFFLLIFFHEETNKTRNARGPPFSYDRMIGWAGMLGPTPFFSSSEKCVCVSGHRAIVHVFVAGASTNFGLHMVLGSQLNDNSSVGNHHRRCHQTLRWPA